MFKRIAMSLIALGALSSTTLANPHPYGGDSRGYHGNHGGHQGGLNRYQEDLLRRLDDVYSDLLRLNPRDRNFENYRAGLIAEARDITRNLSQAAAAPARPPRPIHTLRPIDPRDFKSLVQTVKRANMDDDKLAVLTRSIEGYSFTVNQALELLRLITFSQNQTNAAIELCSHVDEPNAYNRLEQTLTFSSSKRQFQSVTGGVCTFRR